MVATGNPSLTVTVPSDAVVGDLVVLVVGTNNINGRPAVEADGWTRWTNGSGAGWNQYYRVWDGVSSSYGPYDYVTGPDFVAWCIGVSIPNYIRALDGNPFTGFFGFGISNPLFVRDTIPEDFPGNTGFGESLGSLNYRLSPPYQTFTVSAANGLLLGGDHPADAVFTAVYAVETVGGPPPLFPDITPSDAEGTITTDTTLLDDGAGNPMACRVTDRVDVRNAIEDGGIPLLDCTVSPYDSGSTSLHIWTLTVQRTRGPFIVTWELDGHFSGTVNLRPATNYNASMEWQADRYAPNGILGKVAIAWGMSEGTESETSALDEDTLDESNIWTGDGSPHGGPVNFKITDSQDTTGLPFYEDGVTRLAQHQEQNVSYLLAAIPSGPGATITLRGRKVDARALPHTLNTRMLDGEGS